MFTRTAASFLAPTLALVMLAGLPGCKSSSSATSADKPAAAPQQSGELPFPVVHDDWASIGYRLDWVGFPFPGATDRTRVTFVDAAEDAVVMQQSDSTVSVLEPATGKTRWSYQLAGPLTKFVGINRDPLDPNHIYVSSEADIFTLSAANGTLLARDRLSRVVNTRPIIENTTAIYGASTGEIMAHVIGRGVKAWGFMSNGAIEANPVDMGEVVAFVSQGGDVLFFSRNGSLVGSAAIYQGLANNPVAENGRLFIAGLDRSVWAFDTRGNLLWRHRTSTPLTAQPTAHNGVLYVSIPTQGLTAFDQATGKVLWQQPNVQGTVIATRGGRLLVREENGLTLLHPSRGDIVERISTPGIVRIDTDKFVDGNLYAVSNKAVAAKFVPR
jgi:outer membrane protein assembly factor BamB